MSASDSDGLQDIAVWSWTPVASSEDTLLMKCRIRVFAGISGDLIGLLETVRVAGAPVALGDFNVTVAGDGNHDGVLDTADLVAAGSALSADAVLSPTVDCKADGVLTMEDPSRVVERVVDEPQAQRAALISEGLRNLRVEELILPPGSGVIPGAVGCGGGGGGGGAPPCIVAWNNSWGCWLALGFIVLDFAALMAQMAAASTGVTVLAAICRFARLLIEIAAFVEGCLTNGQCLPTWLEICLTAIGIVSAICAEPKKLLRPEGREWLEDLLRRIGRGLGDVTL